MGKLVPLDQTKISEILGSKMRPVRSIAEAIQLLHNVNHDESDVMSKTNKERPKPKKPKSAVPVYYRAATVKQLKDILDKLVEDDDVYVGGPGYEFECQIVVSNKKCGERATIDLVGF